MHDIQHLAGIRFEVICVQGQLRHTNDTIHWGPNFVTHVRQELRLGAVGQFGRFPGRRVTLDTVTEIRNHLVDLPLQFVHLARGVHGDEFRKIPVCGSIGDFAKGAHLRG